MSALVEQISQSAKLVSLPDIYLRLKAVLDDPDSNLADVADVVGKDPAMTARVLRLVNSGPSACSGARRYTIWCWRSRSPRASTVCPTR